MSSLSSDWLSAHTTSEFVPSTYRGAVLPLGAVGDRNPSSVENRALGSYPCAVDVRIAFHALVGPHDQIVRPVEGDARAPLVVSSRRDRDPDPVEPRARRRHARRIDVSASRAIVRPHHEVVRPVERHRSRRWLLGLCETTTCGPGGSPGVNGRESPSKSSWFHTSQNDAPARTTPGRSLLSSRLPTPPAIWSPVGSSTVPSDLLTRAP